MLFDFSVARFYGQTGTVDATTLSEKRTGAIRTLLYALATGSIGGQCFARFIQRLYERPTASRRRFLPGVPESVLVSPTRSVARTQTTCAFFQLIQGAEKLKY